jgi:hypothetical protein
MKKTSYRNGDKIEYTGISKVIHGGLFYEFIWLEGKQKGEKGFTQKGPK